MTISKVNGTTWTALANVLGVAKAAISKVNGQTKPASATRLYFSNAAIPYDPATERGAWDAGTAGYTGIKLGAKAGAAATFDKTESNATNNWDVLSFKCVSDPLPSGVSIEGTASWVLGAKEDSLSANFFIHLHIFVTAGDSDTVRGTLLTDNIGSTEMDTTARGMGEGAVAITTVAAQTGDRIVVELGFRAVNTSTTTFTCTYDYGGTGSTDLTIGSTDTTTQPGWIEFSTALGL